MQQEPLHPEDARLAQRAVQGDGPAREELARRLGSVAGILSSRNARGGRPLRRDELQDLAQDTLIAIWKKLGSFRGDSTLESWAYAFCMLEFRNARRVARREERRRQESMEEARDSQEPAEQDHHADAHEYDDIYLGLDRLPDEQAQVIRLKHFEGMTFEEIAGRTSQSTNTVKTRYYRGLARLRSHLGEREGRRE